MSLLTTARAIARPVIESRASSPIIESRTVSSPIVQRLSPVAQAETRSPYETATAPVLDLPRPSAVVPPPIIAPPPPVYVMPPQPPIVAPPSNPLTKILAPAMTIGPTTKAEVQPVSLLSGIGKALGGVARVAGGFLAGGPPGAIAAGASLLLPRGGAPSMPATIPTGPMPLQPQGAGALIGRIAGPLGGVLGGVAGNALGGAISQYTSAASSANGCGCRGGTGRDPCTGQRTSSRKAQLATFFGGCCPPGHTLRRIGMGRDICIKTPRMNVFNPRALARADRRVTGFARRAAPILHDMGYSVSRTRKVKVKTTRKRARGR